VGCKPTQVIYYSSNYQNRNVHNGDSPDAPYAVTRWQVNNNNFKGFFHTNNQYLNVGATAAFDTGGGYAQGPSDLDTLATCRNQNLVTANSCLMIMPVVRYATGQGTVSLTVVGFLPLRLITDPYGNSNDLAAEITMAVLSNSRDVKTGPCPTNGVPCLKVTRLVQ
jgi:hypothetical protein